MAVKTSQEYLAALQRRRPAVYAGGQRVEEIISHPMFQSTIEGWGRWLFDAAFEPALRSTMRAPSDLIDEEVHVFWHVPRSGEDLLQNLHAARRLSERRPTCGYSSIGRDELVAVLVATYEMDKELGTEYYSRALEYFKTFQREQIMTAAAVTDVKGHRRLRPADQPDPDLYLRVVERRPDGIVVNGAKAHTTGSVAAEELVVIPQRAMRPQDADYAVAFVIPVDAPGIKLICGRHPTAEARESPLTAHDYVGETLTVFDHVFVPKERVFMDGQWQYAGVLANTFAELNRQGYLGADYGKLALYIGAAALIAESNGVEDVPHVRDKITEMIKAASVIWACGVAASVQYTLRGPNVAIPDPVLTNAGKHVAMESHYTAARLLHEIAGGSVVTVPSPQERANPELAGIIDKYYRATEKFSSEQRLRLFDFIHDLAASEYAGWWFVEIIHGSGSPAAERLVMGREFPLDDCKRLVRELIDL